jgi:flagellar assembly protein FliH
MTSSRELHGQRTVVLRGVATEEARPARMSADLRTSPFVSGLGLDPRLVDPTLEAVVADAVDRARVAGREEGRREGLEAARQEIAEQIAAHEAALAAQIQAEQSRRDQELARAVAALRRSAADFDAREATALADLDHSVATLAVEIAEVLVGRHLELGKWSAREAVLRALALAPRQSVATVRVHPDSTLHLTDVSGAVPGGSVTVVADPSIEPGGCIVEAGNRTIDAQVGPALRRLREVLA